MRARLRLWDTADWKSQGQLGGTTLVSGNRSGIVRLWDLDRREAVASLRGHVGEAYAVAFSPDGRFSFRAEVNPSPPIIIGGIPFNRFVVGLTNDSLTFGAGVGINFGGLNIAQAYFEGTIRTNGDFRFLARVDALQVLGFSAAQAQLTLEKGGPETNLTLMAQANFLVATVNINGFIRFASGQYDLRGTANVGVAGFTLSNTTFVATNIGGMRIELHSRTNILNIGVVQFDGLLTRSGGSYTIDVSARATF